MTAQGPIGVFAEAGKRGLTLSFQPPFSLVVEPARRCPADFADTLSQHKPQLLVLLQLPFVMVSSQILGETILFCEDEHTKGALVDAGAEPWSIYTKDELRILVANNRAKPFPPDELCKLHEMKRTFHGRSTT